MISTKRMSVKCAGSCDESFHWVEARCLGPRVLAWLVLLYLIHQSAQRRNLFHGIFRDVSPCSPEAIKPGQDLCLQSKADDRLAQPFITGKAHIMQRKQGAYGETHRLHQDAVELEPVLARRQCL